MSYDKSYSRCHSSQKVFVTSGTSDKIRTLMKNQHDILMDEKNLLCVI